MCPPLIKSVIEAFTQPSTKNPPESQGIQQVLKGSKNEFNNL